MAVFVARFETIAPKAVACLEERFEDAVSVMVLPEKYRRRLRTTNMQERLNEEIRRREWVIRIFPNAESATASSELSWPNTMRRGPGSAISIGMNFTNGSRPDTPRALPWSRWCP